MLWKARIRELASSSAKGDRERIGILEAWTSIVVNVLIAAVKYLFGWLSGSISLLADATHTLSDVVSSAIVLFGFRISAQPPDRSHPFGHGRMELVSAVIMATLLFSVGVEFMRDGVIRLIRPETPSLSVIGFVVVAFTMLLKEGLARFSIWLGRLIKSNALIADGQHHRSDALSTVVVLLALIGTGYGYTWLDGAGGIIVSLFIMHTAYELIRDSVSPLLGQRPDKDMLRRITEIAESTDGVRGTHDIVVHDFQTIYNISIHIEVDHAMSLTMAHDISDRIERAIEREFPGWAVVHVDPVNREHPAYPGIEAELGRLREDYPFMESVHDLRLIGTPTRYNVVFDINAPAGRETEEALAAISKRLMEKFPGIGVVINQDPPL